MIKLNYSNSPFPRAIAIAGSGVMACMFIKAFSQVRPQPQIKLWSRNTLDAVNIARKNDHVKIVPIDILSQDIDVVILATPSTTYRTILKSISSTLDTQSVIVTLSNAITIAQIESCTQNPVVKVIPTIAHELNRGVSVIVSGARADETAVATVHAMMQAISKPLIVPESDSRAVSNLAGSGLAIAAEFASLCVAANEAATSSLDRNMLDSIIVETFRAIAALHQDGRSLEEIVAQTAVQGGITEAAISILRRDGTGIINEMMLETFRRQAILQMQSVF
jgi:pyrroline-5-carboxylate reductase